MPITTDRSAAHDRPAILGLMDEARGLDLSDDERAQAGFVQGAMDESLLARLQSGPGCLSPGTARRWRASASLRRWKWWPAAHPRK